ncbi:ATP-dependent Clp protease ATP-binding subunit [Nonomuraea turkmeniaca]|uniref:ATP-dependent Clp protease ATP-binding subunit n=1 Tax=Nonomuraea turkmeniaca TaxID=103838 RepID=A0A5S4FUH0_9ACTN|nr:Clp protease N-terminal domain-containing protein [Nonomuraea turkmeniaca]TMR24288.1 ATP-dependent Clp protease ATP-binding subunit [Nonomuraea turkmeniaca]
MSEPYAKLSELISFVKQHNPDGPLAELSGAVLVGEHLGELADHLIGHFVDQARRSGASWTEIGSSMGVTKQAAQKRFVPTKGYDSGNLEGAAWDRYTNRAQITIRQAVGEAQHGGHREITPEHLVLGLLHEEGCLATKAIEAAGADVEALRRALRDALPDGGPPTGGGHIPFSAAAKKVRELTLREALRLGHNYLGTEHILLALLDDEDTPAARVLIEHGVTKEAAEAYILPALEEIKKRSAH